MEMRFVKAVKTVKLRKYKKIGQKSKKIWTHSVRP